MSDQHCATCRWYTPMPHEGSDHGDCEMVDGDDRDVLGDDTCEDWTAQVDTPTPGVGCGVGEAERRSK